MADSDFIDVPVEGLLNKSYLEKRKKILAQETTLKVLHTGYPKGAEEFEKNIDISNQQVILL